jgi:hypothetical protein
MVLLTSTHHLGERIYSADLRYYNRRACGDPIFGLRCNIVHWIGSTVPWSCTPCGTHRAKMAVFHGFILEKFSALVLRINSDCASSGSARRRNKRQHHLKYVISEGFVTVHLGD